jgi:hypothetical protein
MRKTVLLLASTALIVLLACGVALAAIINGTNDELVGTDKRDIIKGRGGQDKIRAKGGNGEVYGQDGRDIIGEQR